mmetsp:Transcript_31700/g.75600  ORF Transcript_31700/g.75600 Transcript_31700/m.75600 type:complete len:514 (-) Transcript_31700:32-1573(-)
MLALLEVSQEELHGLAMKAVILGSGTCALACLGERLLSRFRSQAEGKRMSQERAAPQPTQAVASPEDYGVDSARLSEMISGFQERYIDSGRMRGALVAVVRRGQIIGVWEMGGYNSETVFKLYSITKVFTALAGLQICEEENISMDTPVSSLVPEWPKDLYVEDQGKLEKAKETLRLQHCFTHTGGFSNNYGPACHPPGSWRPAEARRLMGILAGLAAGPSDLREMVAMEGRQPLIFEPGSHFDYGGVGLALIARIVEESSGMSIAEYMQKRLFEPAGMKAAGFILPPHLADRCVPTDAHPWLTPALGVMEPSTWAMVTFWIRGLWAKILGRPLVEAFRPAGAAVSGAKKLWDPSQKHFLPDAGLVCPGADFVKWLQALTKPGSPIYGETVLRQLATPVTPDLQAPFSLDAPNVEGRLFPVRGDKLPRVWRQRPFNNLQGQRYSLGACVITDPAKASLPARARGSWHWMGFASTYFFVNPQEELAACFLSQVVSHQAYPILEELLREVHNSLR